MSVHRQTLYIGRGDPSPTSVRNGVLKPKLPCGGSEKSPSNQSLPAEGGGIRGLPRMTEGECVYLQIIADSKITQAPPPLLVSLEAEPPLGGSLEGQGRELEKII